GLHSGYAEVSAGDYIGPQLNHVARLMAAGHGGQVLLSASTRQMLGDSLPKGVSLRDLGEHRLKDLGRTEHIYQVQAQDLPDKFPPLRASQTFLNNLPTQLTSFVGRDKELSAVKTLLAGNTYPTGTMSTGFRHGERETNRQSDSSVPSRLLTLTGPGGTGKTRLALQAAVELLDAYADGVWLLELAPVADPQLVSRALASALGLREDPARPLRESLADYLRPRQALLILDNCEHLIDACAELIEILLHACPRLTVLATSRETLGIPGEMPYRVPSLPSPDLRHLPDIDRLMGFASVRLFAERAHSMMPDFALDQQNVLAVAQICARLDGIPLAIELAAARVKFMRVEQIAARLDDRFRLLTGGSRTALPRQQTLQALIDWSWDMLSEKERIFLRRLAVFAGGWQLEAAEFVCADPSGTLQDHEILDLLTSLANKSMVMTEYHQGREPRYRLLETIRQYARERLAASGESEPVRTRHADWFLQWAETGESNFNSPRIIKWMDTIEMEHDNLRSALEWLLCDQAGAQKGLRLAGALGQFWQVRAYVSEGLRWLDQALELNPVDPSTSSGQDPSTSSGQDPSAGSGQGPGPDPHTVPASLREALMFRARALTWTGHVSMYRRDNPGQNRAHLEEAVELLRRAGPEYSLRLAEALWLLSEALGDQPDAACQVVCESVEIARQAGPSAIWYLANALSRSIYFYYLSPDTSPDQALALAEEAQSISEQAGDRWNINPLLHLARINIRLGNISKARGYFLECIARSGEAGDKLSMNATLAELCDLERAHGYPAEAFSHYQETAQGWIELNNIGGAARCLECMAFLAIDHEEFETAALLLGKADSLRQESGQKMEGEEPQEYERYLTELKSHLDVTRLTSVWRAGAVQTLQGLFKSIEKVKIGNAGAHPA
ncbi:MAG: AAA family ATPase, partial [Anaerolineales bacterium]